MENGGAGINIAGRIAAWRRQIIVISASLLCLYLPAVAETAQTGQTSPASPQGALFRITQADRTLYLFGTIHVGRADFFPLESRVMQALDHASVLALELDPSRTEAMSVALRRHGIAAADADAMLPAALKIRRRALLQRYGIAPDAVTGMQPWLQATMLTVAEFMADGYQPQYSVDGYLSAIFKKSGKPVQELESAESQLALFGALSQADQIRFLDETMAELENPAKAREAVEIASLWRNADSPGLTAKLEKLDKDDNFTTRFTQNVLLKQRNPPLTDGLVKLLQSNRNSFAAIGILHLLGPGSVPALLQQRGYRVEKIY